MKLKGKWQKKTAFVLAAIMSLSSPVTVMADYWQGGVGNWQYIIEKEEETELTKSCWKKIQNNWFHFNQDGQMDTGWYQDTDGTWYYLNRREEGVEGSLRTGWYQDTDGTWYYLNRREEGVEGSLRTGWYQDTDGIWYYLNRREEEVEGSLRTGWYQDIDGTWYYLNRREEGVEGSLRIGWYQDIDGRRYYLNRREEGVEGSLRTGWYQERTGKWYYLEPSDESSKGVMRTGWIDDGIANYFLGEDGAWIPGYRDPEDDSESNLTEDSSNNNRPDDENKEEQPKPDEEEVQIIKTNDNVIAFDSTTEEGLEELKKVYDGIWDYWLDDMNTEDMSDDEYNVVVENSNPLLNYILNGVYQKGDVIFIPACEYFPTGVSLIYQYHDDAYKPDMKFANESYEVIHTKKATLGDIIKEEISFSSDEIEQENPIAFIWTPEYEMDTVEPEMTSFEAVRYNRQITNIAANVATERINTEGKADESASWGAPETVQGAGIQLQNLSTGFIPVMDFEDITSGKIALKMNDIILYDKDGNKDTKYDRIVLGGEVALENIHPEVALDWNPQLTDPLPKQFIAKLSYNEKNTVKITFGGEIKDASEIYKAIKKKVGALTHNNKRSIFGMDIEGIDMSDSIILAAAGINVSAKTVKLSIKSLRDQSIKLPLSPTFLILFTLDINGKLEATVVGEYNYNSYIEKGVNVQKDGYIGNHGTCAENKGQQNYKIGDRNINIYDLKAKSKMEKNKEPVTTISIAINGKAEANAGVGAGFGMMMAGIIPVMLKGTIIGLEASAEANGKATMSSETGLDIEGNISLNAALISDIKLLLKLTAKTVLGNLGIQGEWELGRVIWLQMNITTKKLSGQILESDDDRDDTNNPKLANAIVKVREKGTLFDNGRNVTTDAEGKFAIDNLKEGKYTLSVTKDGYETYETELNISGDMDELTIFLDRQGIKSKISGTVKEADMDSDSSNNQSLSGVNVTIKKLSSNTTASKCVVTDENGSYSFDELPIGLYEIMFEKNGYITVRDEVKVTSSANIYNATMEIISNDYSGNGTASGTIVNAINGQSVGGGIMIKVTEGSRISDADVITTTQTDGNGQYQVILPAGIYTLWLSDSSVPQRYENDCIVIKVLGNMTIDNQNGEMIPLLDTDEIRIVLTWGSRPWDLDSHLTGPVEDDSRFHIFYGNKDYYQNGTCIANLDVDDTNSYGPETTTIYHQSDGIYRFSVHDYTNGNKNNSIALAKSGAYVRVYRNGYSEPETYAVPYQEGTVWNVFDYDSRTGVITPINTMEYESNVNMVGQISDSRMINTIDDVETDEIPLKDYELEDSNNVTLPTSSNVIKSDDDSVVTSDAFIAVPINSEISKKY